MFKKLQKQLMLVCLLGTALVLLLMSLIALLFSRNQLRAQAGSTFASNNNSIVIHVQDARIIDYTWLAQAEASSGVYISMDVKEVEISFTHLKEERASISQQAKSLAITEHGYRPTDELIGLQPEITIFQFNAPSAHRAAITKIPYHDEWITLIVTQDMQEENWQVTKLALVFLATVIGALLLLAVFFWLFSAKAVEPIEESHRRQIEFVSSASHELRSPLAVIQATAGAMKGAPPDVVHQFATTIEKECQRLGILTSDLLQLASADQHQMHLQLSLGDAETVLLATSERFLPLAREKKIALTVAIPDTIFPRILFDFLKMEQVLSILVENALEYTPAGGSIILTLEDTETQMLFSVSDSGMGIPAQDREKIFHRFYRSDRSRTKKEHYGLGLSIAKEIVLLHKGELKAEDSAAGGAKLIVSLPKERPNQ